MMRIGFAVKVLGEGGLPERDARRWQNEPHLRVSLQYLRAILDYLDRNNLRMYRMSSDFVPYATHPDLPQFHHQLDECAEELAQAGRTARAYGIRLSLHPSQYVVLNAQDETIARKAAADLEAQAALLDSMGMGPECVVVTHVGGLYGDRGAALDRFARRYERLSERARGRLVVENDDALFSVADVLRLSALCAIPVVFDNLHHNCHNPYALPMREAVESAISTWPAGVRPKVHFSSPRTEAMEAPRKTGKAVRMNGYGSAPDPRLHSDYINPFEFLAFLDTARCLEFDVMLEAKAKDLAVIKLRRDLVRYSAPNVGPTFTDMPSAA